MKLPSLEIFSPAKINLFLAVMGEREDRFHEILSLVAKVKLGDNLEIALNERIEDKIECNIEGVPLDNENLIMKAIKKIRQNHRFHEGVYVKLNKRIPIGAGFGGGSSNAVATLKGLNQLLGEPINTDQIKKLAMELGSDCPLFLEEGLMVIRGRGEKIERAGKELNERFKGQRILLFKPTYSINTRWAYEEMRKNPKYYVIKQDAEMGFNIGVERLIRGNELESILFNNFENIVFKAYPALRDVMTTLYEEHHIRGLLSGSGSGCFCLLKKDSDVIAIKKRIKEVIGEDIFIVESEID